MIVLLIRVYEILISFGNPVIRLPQIDMHWITD